MKKIKPIILVILCCIVWGTTFTVVKETSDNLNPFILSSLRNLIASVLLFIYLITSRNFKVLYNLKGVINGSVIGFILAVIYISQTFGIKYTSANNSAFITSISVVVVPIILITCRKTILNYKQVLAIIIVIIGLYFLTIKSGLNSLNQGDLITLGASFICAVHIILSGYYVNSTDFLALIFYQFLIAFIVSIIGYFIFKSSSETITLLNSKTILLRVLYLGVFGTLFCYFITVWSQKYIGSIFLALIFSLEPIFASITNFFVLGEKFNFRELIGAIIIFAGIILYSVSKLKFRNVKTASKA